MKIIFAGTPAVAVPSLETLIRHGFAPALVVTRPDAPIGRKRIITPSPVAVVADEHQLPTLKTQSIGPALLEKHPEIHFSEFDLGVVVAYGGIIREPVLSAPRLGWINLHFSALPQYRGAAPVQRAILAGDTETALTVFQLVSELDAGPIISSEPAIFEPNETAEQALARLAIAGAQQLCAAVQHFAHETVTTYPQLGEPTMAPKFDRADGLLDWEESAETIFNRYRAVTSEPGAYSSVDGIELKIHELRRDHAELNKSAISLSPGELRLVGKSVLIGTGTEALQLVRVQPPGKQVMDAADWWRGRMGNRG